jgi:putative heme degradation protein
VSPRTEGLRTTQAEAMRSSRCFVQFFGERPPGGTERAGWRALATGLPGTAAH